MMQSLLPAIPPAALPYLFVAAFLFAAFMGVAIYALTILVVALYNVIRGKGI